MSELRRFNLVSNGYDCYQVNNEIDRLEYRIKELNEKFDDQYPMIQEKFESIASIYTTGNLTVTYNGEASIIEAIDCFINLF